MANKPEALQRKEYLPSLDRAQIILVVPFYNEEQVLPRFISSLKTSQIPTEKIYILGVNHRSKDQSEKVFFTAAQGFATTAVVYENQDVASVGIPRQKGLETAINLAHKNSQHKIIVGSIDTDSIVSSHFFEEAKQFLDTQYDFLLFPTRNDQRQFLDCIEIQKNEVSVDAAIRTLVGIDWLKYQLRALLLKAGAIETRGSGGYFFTVDGYAKAHRHKPVYSAEGTIVTGESNAIGIRAKRSSATAIVSSYLNIASPRRIFKSLRTLAEGYALTSGSKTFEVVDNNQELPVLECAQWMQHFQNMLYGAVRTFIIKAIAYEVVLELQESVQVLELRELLEIARAIYGTITFTADEKDAIGSRAYISIFEQAYENLGKAKQANLMQKMFHLIPDRNNLISWASNTSSVIESLNNLS